MPETSLDIIIRARDEASAKLGAIGKDFLATAAKVTGAVGGLVAISAAVAGTMRLISAQAAEDAARVEGSLSDVVEAQLRAKDGISEIAAAIPLLGGLIRVAIDEFSNREATEKSLQNIREVEQATIRFGETALRLEREVAIQAAKNRGDEAEARRLAVTFLEDDFTEAIKTARKVEITALDELVAAEDALNKVRAGGFSIGFGVGDETGLPDFAKLEEDVALRLEAFRKAGDDAARMERSFDAKIEQQRDSNLGKTLAAIREGKEQEAKINEQAFQRRDSVTDTLEDERLRRMGDRIEIEVRATEKRFDRLAKLAVDHSDLLVKIDLEREAAIAAIRAGRRPGGRVPTDVAGFFSRFLTRAPGRETLAVTFKEELQTQTAALVEAIANQPSGITVVEETL